MCVYVDEVMFETLFFDGDRKARKAHRCGECGRGIEPGESYHRWDGLTEYGFDSQVMCSHCWAFITVTAEITGCALSWYFGTVLNAGRYDYEEGAYASDALFNDEHQWHDKPLLKLRVWHWARCGKRHQWRDGDGQLIPIPRAREVRNA